MRDFTWLTPTLNVTVYLGAGGWGEQASDHYMPIDTLHISFLLVKTNWTQGKKSSRYIDNGSLIHLNNIKLFFKKKGIGVSLIC